mmetsp:Transcript_7012/g.15745  ORF Transcript_7012/g.15745 Transcript_7012/m.15745 type:complete len:206 (-) Transcript_7012:309-926(-)
MQRVVAGCAMRSSCIVSIDSSHTATTWSISSRCIPSGARSLSCSAGGPAFCCHYCGTYSIGPCACCWWRHLIPCSTCRLKRGASLPSLPLCFGRRTTSSASTSASTRPRSLSLSTPHPRPPHPPRLGLRHNALPPARRATAKPTCPAPPSLLFFLGVRVGRRCAHGICGGVRSSARCPSGDDSTRMRCLHLRSCLRVRGHCMKRW